MSGQSEFVSEAQEVVESFSRSLLEIEGQLRSGGEESLDPDLVNAAFRAVHTLKGLASLSGEQRIERLSHVLESSLDALRLGKRRFDQRVLDVLFETVDLFSQLLASVTQSETSDVDINPALDRLTALTEEEPTPDGQTGLAWLDDSVLGVLTEYEEHRLRENLRLGRRIFRVHASFDLLAIDVGIESLKTKLKSYGEVITYLPSADSSSDDRIELDILLGSKATLSELASGIGESGVTIHELGADGETSAASAPAPMARPAEPAAERASSTSAGVDRAPAPVGSSDEAADQTGGAASASGAGGAGGAGSGGGGGAGGGEARPDPSPDPDGLDASDISLRSLSQTVRVDLRRLDSLMNLVGELALVQANLTAIHERVEATELSRDLKDQLRMMNRRLNLLQQGILDVRMVPLGQVFDKLARVVRKLSRESGKEIRLSISGSDTELDKLIVEELSDPLMHMIRNAIDHGIESVDDRIAAGKNAQGHIDLRAFQKGNRVVIEVEDDGRGMDWRAIRDTALRREFITASEAADIAPRQAINMIFAPGFSTKEKASELSGRGVGMDVVKTNIARLSGLIDVASEPGRGSRFSITLPVTLAIIQALVIETAGQTFCIPLNSVLESIMAQRRDIMTVEGHEVVSLRGRTLPLLYLWRLFDLDPPRRSVDATQDRLYVVVVGLAQHRVGLVVDELLGQQDVVIKSLGKSLRSVPGIAGATELGDNRTVLLLDVATLVTEAVGGAEATAAGLGEHVF